MMKKLIFIFLLLPIFAFGQTQLSVNQIASNFETGGIWKPQGVIMPPVFTAQSNAVLEPTVIYESGAQIITNTTGSVFKMWFTGGYASPDIYYAESLDGIHWTNPIVVWAGHARSSVVKVSGTYYIFAGLVSGAQIDEASSSTGLAFGSVHTAIISKNTASWNVSSVTNSSVYYDGTTFQMLLEGSNAGGISSIGYYSSTSAISGWTASGSNPVIATNSYAWGGPYLTKIGSTWYTWVHGSGNTLSVLPTDIYRFHSSNLTTWTQDNSGSSTYPRTAGNEGVNTSKGQVADPTLLEVNGKTYMYFTADSTGDVNSIYNIKLAISNFPMASLILTSEGNGSQIPNQPDVYTKTQSDNNYIPNATNVGANTIWTPGSILLDDQSFYGLRIRQHNTSANFTYVTNNLLNFYNSGGNSGISGGSAGMTVSGWNGITFSNPSGSGASTLGSFDNTGLLTTTSGHTIQGGAFNYQSGTAFAATATFGMTLRNQSASSAGTPVRWSPSIYFNGSVWDTGSASNKLMFFYEGLRPISANPASYQFVWTGDNNFAGDVDLMFLYDGGRLKTIGSTGSGEITYANRPASPYVGETCNFSDSTTNTWGATVAGSGSNHVQARWNGTNWTVTGI